MQICSPFRALAALLLVTWCAVVPAAELAKPTVLITGASRGIGFELARQYAERGWGVIATARNPAGAEALLRWPHPERGAISPDEFVPIAEETGLIIPIGQWVLREACRQVKRWSETAVGAVPAAVNISSHQFRDGALKTDVFDALTGAGIDASLLELEITESVLLQDVDNTLAVLKALKNSGISLSIDDFGTGYSSLSALQQFPISTLKIDQSFVRDLASSPDDATLVSTIVQMGRNLHMDVVAEGVENADQLRLLQRFGCTFAQGLLFGDPMSSDSYLELLLAQADGTDERAVLFG